MNLPVRITARQGDASTTALWVALIAAASIVSSYALACAAPFVAMIAVAACFTPRRWQLALAGFAWVANQAIGFTCLGYTFGADTFAWGGIMGAASMAAAGAAMAVAPRAARFGTAAAVAAAFAAAFGVYELVLLSGCLVLPGSEAAFTPAVIAHVLQLNALALAILLSAQRALVALRAVVSAAKSESARA